MRFLLDSVYLLAVLLVSPKLLYRVVRQNRYRRGWGERFGKISRNSPQSRCIWIHAVSVGEVNATRTLIKELAGRFNGYEIVLSTSTDTGFARASTLFGDHYKVFYFPLDFSWIMRRAFARIRPAICLLMELEAWPNFLHIARSAKIPVVVVNGRISDKSYARYSKIRPLAKKIFEKVNLVLAQTNEYAARFKNLGCPEENIAVTGSLKYDTAKIVETVEGAEDLNERLNIRNGRVWVAGGTGDGEEKIVLDVYKQLRKQSGFNDLRLVIVPRKPERFELVAQLIEQEALPFIRYSRLKNGEAVPPVDNPAVILGDTMGDLRKFYSLATIVFVGRSLVPMGGSDMMEAAALGKCSLFGPHAFNFRQTVEALLQGQGAIMVRDADGLLRTMQKCLSDADFAARIARNGLQVIKNNQGATAKSVEHIAELLAARA